MDVMTVFGNYFNAASVRGSIEAELAVLREVDSVESKIKEWENALKEAKEVETFARLDMYNYLLDVAV